MVAEIQLLPDDIVNKIAAGEIIERPVSIVKELVENCLDAGATEIRVEIESGGKQVIRVSDNGCGIAARQAELAFERHATSKIRAVEDLHNIGTMGFRGEALASIASVCQVTMKTRTEAEDSGISLFIVNGKCQSSQPIAMPAGTTIEARSLFFNQPARRKFLKSDAAEASAIGHMLNAFAVAHPEVSFHFYQEQRHVLNCPATATLRERVFQVFGSEMLESLLELDETMYHFRVAGFVSSPDALKTNKNYQYFFINRRFVKDKVLANSLYVAYRVYAETGQYPVAFLFLDIPVAMVDVNVHPAKYEVRFLQQGLVQKGIIDTIQKALHAARPLPTFQLPGGQQQQSPYLPRYSGPELSITPPEAGQPPSQPGLSSAGIAPAGMQMPSPALRKMPAAGEYKIIGQYDNTYILLSDEAGLIIVDQHVAHERILYEQLIDEQQNKQRVAVQPLLIPLVMEVNPAQMMLIEEYGKHFEELGFVVEVFGISSVVFKQIPDVMSGANYTASVQALINDLEKLYREGLLESCADEMRKSVACQAAVKINMPLTMEKMEYLIQGLLKTRTPQVCPHGRPIILRISHYEIQKNFRRI